MAAESKPWFYYHEADDNWFAVTDEGNIYLFAPADDRRRPTVGPIAGLPDGAFAKSPSVEDLLQFQAQLLWQRGEHIKEAYALLQELNWFGSLQLDVIETRKAAGESRERGDD